jgi:general secretion pathway protein G
MIHRLAFGTLNTLDLAHDGAAAPFAIIRRLYREHLTTAMNPEPKALPAFDRRHPPVRRHSLAGFTLIEIMVVVVILGILAALVAPNVIRRIDDARVTKAQQDIRAYETALNLYRMDNFRYPTTDQGLKALVEKPSDPNVRNWKQGGYIDGLKKDPWGNDYVYIAPGTRGEYDLYTLGADGAPGGEGPDADVTNWNIE